MRTVIKLFFPLVSCFAAGGPAIAEDAVAPAPVESLAPRSLALEFPTKWDFKGLFRTEFEVYQKPSGKAGNSEFHIPYAAVEGLGELRPNLFLDFEVSHSSPVKSGANSVSVQRFNARLIPAGLSGVEFEVGLIEPAYSRFLKRDWTYDNLNTDLFWPAARWGYTYASDYGVQLSQIGESFSWGLGIANGEGPAKQSDRAQKDAFVWADINFLKRPGRQTHFLVHALKGAYDNIPTPDAGKDRTMLLLASKAELGLSFGVEYWSLRDPADAISGKAAGGVDLASFGGERVRGQLLSSQGSYSFGSLSEERYELFYRSDAIQPVAGEVDRDVTADHFGFVYSPQPGLDWIFLFSDIEHGERHSQAARDQQLWRLSFNVTWD